MGRGKTKIIIKAAMDRGLELLVICPKSVRHNWITELTTHMPPMVNLPNTGCVITYDDLRGNARSPTPAHGLLIRSMVDNKLVFTPTVRFQELLQRGIMLVVDEVQYLKNTTDQHRAAKALLTYFHAGVHNSRMGLLSGTMFDKPEHCVNFAKLIGFIEEDKMYIKKVNGEIEHKGIDDLHRWGHYYNPEGLQRFMMEHPIQYNPNFMKDYAMRFFIEVLKPVLIHIMPNAKFDGVKDVMNGYYILGGEDAAAYAAAQQGLKEAVSFVNGSVTYSQHNMGSITKQLCASQMAKVNATIRKGYEYLNKSMLNDDGVEVWGKLVITADYHDVIDALKEGFAPYKPLILTGKVNSEKKRAEIVAKFMQPDHEYRPAVSETRRSKACISVVQSRQWSTAMAIFTS